MSADSADALYVHVPFCVRKCAYCDFYSGALTDAAVQNYLEALWKELSGQQWAPETVYIGGGTPSALNWVQLAALLEILADAVEWSEVREYTIEINPGTVSRKKMDLVAQAGINRVSVGAQSMDERRLQFLGRIHGVRETEKTVALLKEYGLTNFSLDLMYGLPGETVDEVATDVRQLLALNPSHISTYCLSIEEGTPLGRLVQDGVLFPADDDVVRQQYDEIRRILQENGMQQYEISNFARAGLESRHNQAYWTGKNYYGAGPAAHSYINGQRFSNVASLEAWRNGFLAENGTQRIIEEQLTPEKQAREQLVMGLRLMKGVDLAELGQRTGINLADCCAEAISELKNEGFLAQSGTHIRLTEKAYFVSNAVFSELI